MKIRVLAIGLLVLLGVVGCAHQPVSQGGNSEDMFGGTVGSEPFLYPSTGLEPYVQTLSDPGPF